MKVELTKSQCRTLAEFIEMNLFQTIRNDIEIDSIDWLYDMTQAHGVLSRAPDEEVEEEQDA